MDARHLKMNIANAPASVTTKHSYYCCYSLCHMIALTAIIIAVTTTAAKLSLTIPC